MHYLYNAHMQAFLAGVGASVLVASLAFNFVLARQFVTHTQVNQVLANVEGVFRQSGIITERDGKLEVNRVLITPAPRE
jgi:hypothetical protein